MFSLQLYLSSHLWSHNYPHLKLLTVIYYIPKLSSSCALLPPHHQSVRAMNRVEVTPKEGLECLNVSWCSPVLEHPLLTLFIQMQFWFGSHGNAARETWIGSCWHSWSFLGCHLGQRTCWCCLKLCEGLQKVPLCTNDGVPPLKFFLLIVSLL